MTKLRRPREALDAIRVNREVPFDPVAVVDEVLARDGNDRSDRRPRGPRQFIPGVQLRSGAGVSTVRDEVFHEGVLEGGQTVYLRTEISATPGIRPDDYKAIVDRVMGIARADHPRRTTSR